MRSALAPSGAGRSGADRETRILAEGVSKRYPGRRVLIFPPVLSIFERDLSLFRGRRSPTEIDMSTLPDAGADYDLDDDDDDDDDGDERDRGFEDGLPPARARSDQMFWALKDVSLRVGPGEALGVLGGPGAGKSTLLRILSGRAFPTEGRVLVRGRVAPLPEELQKAIGVAGKRGDDLVLACRLLGVEPHLVKGHKDEIEELAQPLTTPDGDPVRGARMRLAIATTAVLPASVILLEEPKGLDEAFTERVFERLRKRLRSGTALVLASRRPEFVQELCDEVIVLHEGSIADRGDAKQTAGRYDAEANGGQTVKETRAAAKRRTEAATPQSRVLSQELELHVPRVVAGFNESAALLSAELYSAAGVRSKRLDADDELVVEIRLETAARDTEVLCGVCFTPRTDGTGVRLELPEPVRLAHPRTYVLVARIPPRTLRSGGYEVRADAIVAGGATPEASVIARYIGRLRIVGDEPPVADAVEPPVTQWDGRPARRVDAEWSIDPPS
jgi:ABC-type polysaccharide/polyol phosphate transport system ATPase subunit